MARDVVLAPKDKGRKFSVEVKIRIVLEGLRGEISVSKLFRRESISIDREVYYSFAILV